MLQVDPQIEGVKILPLKVLFNERGRLMEVQREDDEIFPGFGQVYITSTHPGVIKAWYRHYSQIDQIALVSGSMKLVLYDARKSSFSYAVVSTIMLEEHTPKLVQIPPGIWHGFQAIDQREAFVLHLNSQAFQTAQPDEDRLPYDTELIPYRW